jgi:hypothetical protein
VTTGQIRSILYAIARLLGDYNAGYRSVQMRSLAPLAKRAGRRIAGRYIGQLSNRIFR